MIREFENLRGCNSTTVRFIQGHSVCLFGLPLECEAFAAHCAHANSTDLGSVGPRLTERNREPFDLSADGGV